MKSILNGLRVATLGVAALAATSTVAEELRIGTASQGGAFYPVGQAISTLVNEHAEGLTMVPVVTQGSVQNPRLVNSGEVDIAITNNNLAVLANKGVGPYKKAGPMNLRAIGSLHFSVLHMMTLDGSGINSIADLKGKRVAVGPAGGGTIPFLTQVLDLQGLTMDDITPSFLSYSDGFSQLADGNVDAAFALSGYPAGAVMQAQTNTKLKYIPMSDADIEAALAKYPNYNKVIIPADVYNTDTDGALLGVNNMLIVDASMSDETAMKITAAIYDNLDAFRAENAHARQIDPQRSLELKIPLHPGAAAYFTK
ncbi:TAXI family TRAP transporter solute-binding subunit [Thiosulfatihalobacter marinus]|uniref:TAXI family TRAP transporter solute-binding subunit n=1 Tax=Thiosulfatihalobacter marinus TaxID=2792481 RepID=UPI0018D9FC06|nr:TAXI family TRAP transporter solute-binding subunit [Thiosulfatihalobacter marinus]